MGSQIVGVFTHMKGTAAVGVCVCVFERECVTFCFHAK